MAPVGIGGGEAPLRLKILSLATARSDRLFLRARPTGRQSAGSAVRTVRKSGRDERVRSAAGTARTVSSAVGLCAQIPNATLFRREPQKSADQDVSGLQPRIRVAEEVGRRLGERQVLQPALPPQQEPRPRPLGKGRMIAGRVDVWWYGCSCFHLTPKPSTFRLSTFNRCAHHRPRLDSK